MRWLVAFVSILVWVATVQAQETRLQGRVGSTQLAVPYGIIPEAPPFNAPICAATVGGAAANACTDASSALNSAITAAVAANLPLIIDNSFMLNQTVFLGTTNLTTICTPNGRFLLGPSPRGLGGNVGLIGQASYQQGSNQSAPINHVTVNGPCQVVGDPTHAVGGNMIGMFCDYCVFDRVWVNYYGGATTGPNPGGRSFLLAGKHTTWITPRATNPYQNGSVGGLRVYGGSDFQVINSYIESGDDAYQCVPAVRGTAVLDIDGVTFLGADGFSTEGRLFIASLVDLSNPHGVLSMTNHVHNCTFQTSGGVIAGVRAVLIENLNSSGDISNTVVSNLHVVGQAGVTSEGNPRAIDIVAFNATTPIVNTIIEDCDVRDPYQSAFGGGNQPGVATFNGSSSGTTTLTTSGTSGTIVPGDLVSGTGVPDGTKIVVQLMGTVGGDGQYQTSVPTTTSGPLTAASPVSSGIFGVIFRRCNFGHASMPLLAGLASPVNAGDTSITIPSADIASTVRSGDLLGIMCGVPHLGQEEQVTAGAVTGNTIAISPSMCASAVNSFVYDYDEFQLHIVIPSPSGSNIVNVDNSLGINNGDAVVIIFNDGVTPPFSSTIANVGPKSNCIIATLGEPDCWPITLTGNLPAPLTVNGLFVDQGCLPASSTCTPQDPNYSISQTGLIKNVVRGEINDSIISGSGSNVLQFGANGVLAGLATDVSLTDTTILNIPPASYGVLFNGCDHCPVSRGQYLPTIGSTTSNAIKWNAIPPIETTSLASSMLSTDTTFPLMNSLFVPYVHSYYAKVDNEVVKVTGGFDLPVPTIVRGQLNTMPAAHAAGATVSVAQGPATESPAVGIGLGGMANTNCSSLFSLSVGQGNYIRDFTGCDATTINVGSTAGAIPFTDFAANWRYTTAANITGLTLPVFGVTHSLNFSLFNKTGGSVTLANGNGWNTGGIGTITIPNNGVAPFYFDAITQQAYYVNSFAGGTAGGGVVNGSAFVGTGAVPPNTGSCPINMRVGGNTIGQFAVPNPCGSSFTGSSSGTTALAVSGVTGAVRVGDVLSGPGVPPGTTIAMQLSGGTGGMGNYLTSVPTTTAGTLTTTSTVTLNFLYTATNGWSCNTNDITTPTNSLVPTADTTTNATFTTSSIAAGDLINFACAAY